MLITDNLASEPRRRLFARPRLGCGDHFERYTVGVQPCLGRSPIGTVEKAGLVVGSRLRFEHCFLQMIGRIGYCDGIVGGCCCGCVTVQTDAEEFAKIARCVRCVEHILCLCSIDVCLRLVLAAAHRIRLKLIQPGLPRFCNLGRRDAEMLLLRKDTGGRLEEHSIAILSRDSDLVLEPACSFSRCKVDGFVALFEQVESVDGFEWDHDAGGLVATPVVYASQRKDEHAGVDEADRCGHLAGLVGITVGRRLCRHAGSCYGPWLGADLGGGSTVVTRVWGRCASGLVHTARIGDLADILLELVHLVLEEHDAHRVGKTRLSLCFLLSSLVRHCKWCESVSRDRFAAC